MRRLLLWLTLLLGCAWGSVARAADTCTVSMTNIDFGTVSPISGTDYVAQATGTFSCLFSSLNLGQLLTPNAQVCISLGLGTNSTSALPRKLGNGSKRIEYNVYVDSSYTTAKIWGGAGVTGAPATFGLILSAGLLAPPGTYSTTFTVYAKIPAGTALAAVPTVANANTVYTSSFAGQGTYTYTTYGLVNLQGCSASSGSFGFTVNATAVNDCTITASPMAFANASILTGNLRSTSTLSVRCVNNNAYQIALNGGSVAANVANRQMKNSLTTDKVSYLLSSALDGPLWGDGTAGTSMVTGTGTGASVPLTIYGRVPAQVSPRPGDYKDTVTATIYF
ncbi:Csu type fimbrial protein [Janthinobacterium sp. ROICE36]|uniref:Csu type fimbrial protein n=1 Tax=Janthinobacterium sp. ROICE36 TaxID=2048670 RepID=UPI0015E11F0B|nr:spore coat U domain-containing protein [Janthinobacterium sp. ROICE36]